MSFSADIEKLRRLASLYGVLTAYDSLFQRRAEASAEALLAVLTVLGAPIEKPEDMESAWRDKQQSLWRRLLEPVIVAWDGALSAQVRLPAADISVLNGHLKLESGEQSDFKWKVADLPDVGGTEVEGTRYLVKQLTMPGKLPPGYHDFALRAAGKTSQTLIISAPRRAYMLPEDRRTWGTFIPLYALHSQKSWGSGDFSDFEALAMCVAGMGGGIVATLPFLASFLDEPFVPSPYSPASRLFWNEFYLDVERIPELSSCGAAQTILASPEFQEELKAIRQLPLVDYRRQMAVKRRILEALCKCLFDSSSSRLEELNNFVRANPLVEDYASFRAAGEFRHATWYSWPQPMRDGTLREGDYNEETKRYHLYVQWLSDQQIKGLSDRAREKDLRLYLDLPLGANFDGYDVWRERSSFVLDVSVGAPPDVLFTNGQNWGFPPLHPERIREQGYHHVRAYLQHHLKYSGALRIDHIMGIHRLFWIPKGIKTSEGVYVKYKADEFYAILTLESQRSKCIIVGEDLGTVPPEVRLAMKERGLYRMYVTGYELYSDSNRALHPVPPDAVAYVETHDMPTFAAFWQGLDIGMRLKIHLLDAAGEKREREQRLAIREALAGFLRKEGLLSGPGDDALSILKACLAFLSESESQLLIVNLENLWSETEGHNIPGTAGEHPNWQRKARYDLETLCQMAYVTGTLRFIDSLRRERKSVKKD